MANILFKRMDGEAKKYTHVFYMQKYPWQHNAMMFNHYSLHIATIWAQGQMKDFIQGKVHHLQMS